jgi:dimethylglycine dehydrogenase
VHITGGIMLAGTRERVDWLKMAKARGRYLGMDFEIISVDEAAKLFPLMDKKHFVGAMYDPIEGHVDPYGVTHAYAKSAQIGGAEIVRQTRVTDLKPAPDGTWDVITEQGQRARRARRQCRRVVGARGRPHGRLELPVLAMEHQYLITGDMPELAGKKSSCTHRLRGRDLHAPGARRHADGHLRARRRALVRATTTPWDFGQDLLPNDLERIAPSLEVGFEHFPALGGAASARSSTGRSPSRPTAIR